MAIQVIYFKHISDISMTFPQDGISLFIDISSYPGYLYEYLSILLLDLEIFISSISILSQSIFTNSAS